MKNEQSKTEASRLIGWLVSYAMDEMGKAFEIRSGRTLISAGDGKGPVIRLESKGISNPHLAMKGTTDHSLVAQDIFSEHGSYLSRSNNKGEEAIEGPVELQHGDWIRVGPDTRFQLCLIEGARR
jgi:pSer/pThr/pTyr-binding forkhead associated (FHA) protein